MKGFFNWFKQSAKMKRWLFIILLGIVLTCYGISNVLVLKEVSFEEVAKIVVIFVVGFICMIMGLVFCQKRTLELLVEETDDRMAKKKNVNVKSLIFNRNIYNQGPKIVVIGGGSGLDTVLTGLKKYTDNLTAIVTVSDYGKDGTISEKELGTASFEDIKESMIALSNNEDEMRELFEHKFSYGKLKDLSFGDLYLYAMQEANSNIADSINKSNKILNIVGKIMPVTLDNINICAELENGYVIEERDKIAETTYDKFTKISRVYIKPTNCKAAPGVLEAIKDAECIIIGPGSLYTNIIPNLLVNGVSKAIRESNAKKIYISNIMTDPGQTDDYTMADHINAIKDHVGEGIIDYCIYDTGEIIPEYIRIYNKKGAELVEQDTSNVKGVKFLKRDLSVVSNGCIRHDPMAVAKSIIELICDDLKYEDKEKDPEYMMLNTKLREDKIIMKKKKAQEKKERKIEQKRQKGHDIKKEPRRKSKFNAKYKDRIQSLKECDEKTLERRKRALEEKVDIDEEEDTEKV